MTGMDASQSALDSLRTVEFRETLKGYHRDDVDEYLEKAAVEAEGLQEQLRQSGERLRQAAERISQLETALEQQPPPAPAPAPAEPAVPDDTLQRTLILAQQFVDQTKADAEAQAARTIAEADAAARMTTNKAQAEASQIASESEQRLREEIDRLEGSRTKLTQEVEAMSHHLEAERNRLRTALSDILRWVDENVQPASAGTGAPSGSGAGPAPAPGATPAATPPPQDGNRPAAAPQAGAPSQSGTGTGPSADVTQMRPSGITTAQPDTTAALPR
jgi:DivIVA domain-containing protein